jgi:hypothetical protein
MMERLRSGIVGVAILFWGWQVNGWLVAVPLAMAGVLPLWVRARLPFSRADFHRALEVCWLLALGGVLWVYSQESVGNVLRTFFRWTPLVAAPAWLVQVWSTEGRVPASALIPLPAWRRRMREGEWPMDMAPLFAALCVLAASTAGGGRPEFFVGLLMVVGMALWAWRMPGAPVGVAAVMFGVAAWGSWNVSRGMAEFQQWVEARVIDWTSQWQREGSPSRISRTSIGQTGRVGGTGRIVFEATPEAGVPMPWRWRTAAFSAWRDGSWYAGGSGFQELDGTEGEWVLDADARWTGAVAVEWARGRTRGLIPLPLGTRRLVDLPADKVEVSPLGVVRVEISAGVVPFRAEYAEAGTWESPPSEEDQHGVPTLELPAIRAVAEALELAGQTSADMERTVANFFAREFHYTVDLVDTPAEDARAVTPVGRFLLGHRTGHCEFFATAATLLLREAGVPARYVTGYLLNPSDRVGGRYRVRDAQAHAWVQVWRNDAWVDFDPTPSVDFSDPAVAGNVWTRRWHALRFTVARWWWLGEKRLLRQAYWLVLPLVALLLWRFRSLRAAQERSGQADPSHRAWPGLDSEWYAAEAALTESGWSKGDRETLSAWRRRLETAGWTGPEVGGLAEGWVLHQRLRFDPPGLEATERGVLARRAEEVAGQVRQKGRPEAMREGKDPGRDERVKEMR